MLINESHFFSILWVFVKQHTSPLIFPIILDAFLARLIHTYTYSLSALRHLKLYCLSFYILFQLLFLHFYSVPRHRLSVISRHEHYVICIKTLLVRGCLHCIGTIRQVSFHYTVETFYSLFCSPYRTSVSLSRSTGELMTISFTMQFLFL